MFPEDRFVEILIIGALLLIVVGPKDLPILMRKVGKAVGKMRAMAAEFRASFDELARQSELDELRREVEALRSSQQTAMAKLASPISSALADPGEPVAPAPAAEAAPAEPSAPAIETSVDAKPKPATRKPRSRTKAKVAEQPAAPESPGGAT